MSHPSYQEQKRVIATGTAIAPLHWNEKRLRFATRLNPSRSEIRLPGESLVSFIPMEAVGELGGLSLDSERLLDDVGSGYTYFVNDDVVIAKITPCFENGKGALAADLVNGVAFGTTELHVVRSNSELHPKFLFYISISDHFRRNGESEMYGAGGQKRIPDTFIKDFRALIPPPNEQSQIVSYLDRETARIDALIEKKRRLLKLLEEKQLALITHAVTKGLDSSAPMKPAGQYWLAEIPNHWSLLRIANLTTKITNGFVGPTRDILVESGTRYIQSLHIKNGKILFNRGTYYVSDEWSLAHSKSILRQGDVLVVQTGAEVGQTAVVDREHEGCNCHALIILTPRSELVRGEFLELYLRSDIGRKYLQSIETGALHPHLNCMIIRDLYVPLPPTLEEQDRIIANTSIDFETFDTVRRKNECGIELLREYRSALITNAVTGKIDVREAAQKEAAE